MSADVVPSNPVARLLEPLYAGAVYKDIDTSGKPVATSQIVYIAAVVDAEIERLRAALEPLVAEVSTVMRGEHGADWDAYFGPLFDMLERAQNVLHEAAPRDETAP